MASKKGKKGGEELSSYKLLGRPGNHLKMGVVGLPNVGKSSFFNVLCKMEVEASNFPFCTIDPNLSRCAVPDERWEWLCEQYKPGSRVPAYLQVTDIAGLVKGAHEGQGLGNAFLSHISAVDGIYHVIRVFEDEDITHVEGDLDPVRDLQIITEELILKDVERMEGELTRTKKEARSSKDKFILDCVGYAEKVMECLKANKQIRFQNWSSREIDYLNTVGLLTAKPVIVLVNMKASHFKKKKNKWLMKIFEWVKENAPGEKIIPISVDFEQGLFQAGDEGRAAYIEEHKCESSLDKVILAGYEALDLHHYFTAGEKEVKCWTLRRGTKAPGAAGVIHTDFEKGFICADVMHFVDLKEHETESGCKAAGKYMQKGKDYVVEDGDVCLFKFNPPKGGSKPKGEK